jgi:DNA modification methylase
MDNKTQTILEQELSNFKQLDQDEQQNGPVECLGKTFNNDQERRDYYLAILAEKLKDAGFRKIEGFPIGADEDILNLSDPPYYTACPNPFIEDFIFYYGRPYDPNEQYKREPYAADVNEGKNDPIYNAHSYHTKVPHKAIMRYILHYTNPGDVVFDGFCGTGMTGVAAQMCGDRNAVESLGYRILHDGTILQEAQDEATGKVVWLPFSKLGVRRAILNDLAPAATFISSNYNASRKADDIERLGKEFLSALKHECEWMYETKHSDGRVGRINYVIWSEVFSCPECAQEMVFWDVAVDEENGKVRDKFNCSGCGSSLNKRTMSRVKTSYFEKNIGVTVQQTKSVPVQINYFIESERKAFKKRPDANDLQLINKIDDFGVNCWYPTDPIVDGDKTPEATRQGYTHINHLFTRRNLYAFATAWRLAPKELKWAVTGSIQRGSKQHQIAISRIGGEKAGVGGATAGHRRGTLYIPSNQVEMSIITLISERIDQFKRASFSVSERPLIQTASITSNNVPSKNSLDYIFIDPPFGSNIMYSELSQIWESWLKVNTNNQMEAIENKTQNKKIDDYRDLMKQSFRKAYEALKPGRWMTVEFSNTNAAIWNTIYSSIAEAGFIIANISALNKGRGGLNAIVGVTAVKQDLIISAYKPNGGFEDRFINESNEEGVWDFIHTHLGYLPVVKKEGSELIKVHERDPRILFDQVVAYFVRNLRDVPVSSKEFQQGLLERFAERDGMIFLPEQVAQYDKARITSSQLRQLTLFVDDEASAIEWLRQLLNDKPQTYQDIHPKFINELSGWKKAELQLELSTLLEQNFLKFDGQGLVPSQIHSHLSTYFKDLRGLSKDDPTLMHKAKDRWYVPNPEREEDLQKLRERWLLKQFEEYKNHTDKKIKLVRMEAVRAGFKKAWQERDYATIIKIAEKIPENLLQEDQKLLMWYDQAQTRHSDSGLF